jgi:hypothetical protein
MAGTMSIYTHPKVRFLTGDISQSQFSLTPLEFADIMLHVNTIILNAWLVNVNSGLENFKRVMLGIKWCADLL